MNSDVKGEQERSIVGSRPFAGGAVDIGGVEQGFEVFDEIEERDIDYSRMKAYADMEIVQRMTYEGIASHFDSGLAGAAAVEGVPDSFVDIELVKHTIQIHLHWEARRSPVMDVLDVCPARLVEDDYNLESPAEDGLAPA